jgi:hypothetical protein
MNYFIQTSNGVTIENIPNLNAGDIDPETLNLIANKTIGDTCFFIIKKEDVNNYRGLLTIGESEECSISIVTDNNINTYLGKQINNAYLFASDNLFDNFSMIVNNVRGFIELKFPEGYDADILNQQLFLVTQKIKELELSGSHVMVKNITGYKSNEKFDPFGYGAFFIGADGFIYYHPSFYYQKTSGEAICHISEFDKTDEKYYHFTKPHLMCITCETFYCNRNIYNNRLNTKEYLVPAASTCALTTLVSNHSKSLFNELTESNMLPLKNLDRIESFDAEVEYISFINQSCQCNRIKKINFSERMMYK